MASSGALQTYRRGDSIFQSATFTLAEHLNFHARHHESLLYFLTVTQHYKIDIIPITWQSALDDLGRGASAVVNQSMINAQLNFAFKRTDLDATYAILISEVAILSQPHIREHPNINALEGFCWEIRDQGPRNIPAVWPVLIQTKAEFGDFRKYLRTDAGMKSSLRQKLAWCLDIAQALETLHDCGVVHGDLKPENCLAFQDEATEKTVAKVTDFGFSSIWAGPNDVIPMPRTKPWNAPEWHHRGFIFEDAVRMDVYSFGLLCLWCVVQSHELDPTIEAVKDLLFTAEGQWRIDVLERLQRDGRLTTALENILVYQDLPTNKEHSILSEIVNCTLQGDVKLRHGSLASMIIAFDDGLQHRDHRSKGMAPPSLTKAPTEMISSFSANTLISQLPTHALVNLKDDYLLWQLAASDIEVRIHLVAELISSWNDDQVSSCRECRKHHAFQLAFHYFTGFGVIRDVSLSERWVMESNGTMDDLHNLVEAMQKGTYKDALYRSERVQNLAEQVMLDTRQPDFRWAYAPESRAKIDELVALEADNVADSTGSTSAITAMVKEKAAVNFNERGDYLQAVRLRTEVRDIFLDSVGADSAAFASATNDLAGTLADLGRLDEAGDLAETASRTFETQFGNENSRTWASLSTLSFVRTLQGRYEDALNITLKTVHSVESLYGKYHPIVCYFLGNLAGLYYYLERLEEGERLSKDVLERNIHSLGVSHSGTIRAKASLARVYMDQGRLSESEALHIEVTQLYQDSIGAQHPNTLIAMGELGGLYRLQNRLDEAEMLLSHCWRLSLEVMGPDHPSTLGIESALSSVYADQGRSSEALELEAKLYSKMKIVKGQRHPQTLIEESEQLELQLLRAKSERLSNDHPQTIIPKWNLTKIYATQSRFPEAENLFRQVLDAYQKTSGPSRPFTLRAKADLSAVLHKSYAFKEVLRLMQEVLESRENIYRPSHHLIFRALESIAAIQHDMKQYEDEELTRLQLVDRSRSSLEENDPQTLNAIQQLLRFYTENREWNEAAKYLQEEVDLWRRLDSEDSSGLLMALANLSATYACVGQWKLAAESMREILDDKVASLGEEHVDSFEARGLLDFFDSQIHSDASETDKQVEWRNVIERKRRG